MLSIILVDDEVSTLTGLTRWVRWSDLGYHLAGSFSDGTHALEFLKQTPVDVVVTDIRMTLMSGIELAETIQAEYPTIAVVFISAHRDFEYARKALRCGVTDYLLKPISLVDLTSILARIHDERQHASAEHQGCAEPLHAQGETRLIRLVKELVETHLAGDLTLETMAQRVKLSPTHLSHVFGAQCCSAYSDYVRERRIARAKRLLLDPTQRISDVSRASGYENTKYFARVFRGATGMTPRDYRNAASDADVDA